MLRNCFFYIVCLHKPIDARSAIIFTMAMVICRFNDVVQFDAAAEISRAYREACEKNPENPPKPLTERARKKKIKSKVASTMKICVKPGHIPANSMDHYIYYKKDYMLETGKYYILIWIPIKCPPKLNYKFLVENVLHPESKYGKNGKRLDGDQVDGIVINTNGHCLAIPREHSKVAHMSEDPILDSYPSTTG